MNKNNSKTLLVKAAGFLGVAGLSVLISLPGFSQQSPGNTNPNVPSTVKPTNPGGQDAGTTNGGEDLNRVPSSGNQVPSTGNNAPNSGSTMQQNNSSDPINRVEGRDQGTPGQMNSSPNGSNGQRGTNQPGANQPGSTTGGDSSQQVEQNRDGSNMQRNQAAPQGSTQSSPQSPQSDSNSGSSTSDTSTSQQQPTDSSVRALW
ncbi:MAG: hypothetical protein KME42_07610 [Tildeniella nuda ZEHNDER 1965/U140]|jgi:hypothetical protein|nr:hypothetical protein [Tildeniella nuda ZEHNDER 1965/U140]